MCMRVCVCMCVCVKDLVLSSLVVGGENMRASSTQPQELRRVSACRHHNTQCDIENTYDRYPLPPPHLWFGLVSSRPLAQFSSQPDRHTSVLRNSPTLFAGDSRLVRRISQENDVNEDSTQDRKELEEGTRGGTGHSTA